MRFRRGEVGFFAIAYLILASYGVLAVVFWANRGVNDNGPLSFHRPAAKAPLPNAVPLTQALHICYPHPDKEMTYKVTAAVIDSKPYYGCYEVERDGGAVFDAKVIDGRGGEVSSQQVLKRSGAWRWIGTVKTVRELWLGGLLLAAIPVFCWLYYRKLRPGAPVQNVPWWQGGPVVTLIGLIPVLGWVVVRALPGVSRRRQVRVIMQSVLVTGTVLFGGLLLDGYYDDALSYVVLLTIVVMFTYSIVAGREWIAPTGFGAPEDLLPDAGPAAPPVPLRSANVPMTSATESNDFSVEQPEALPTFADIGGLENLKAELRDVVSMALSFPEEADKYGIRWNGVLLHGPPGVGKTFFARATAGEFGLRLVQVSAGDLVSAYRGASARNVDDVFRLAVKNVPCLLFFDEFDAVAEDRVDAADPEARRTVGQLLESLEQFRDVRELIVMAATNHLDQLDAAVIRAGRFDRHVRVDLPDEGARRSILAACLRQRPLPATLQLDELARRTEGMTPAAIAQTVQMAAIDAFKEATATGRRVELTQERLLDALSRRGGEDRPTVEDWTWDAVVLPEATKDELQELQFVIEDPDGARRLGIEPPKGVLLAGPPGTGKTTIAKVLAAQAKCSFYPVTAADITSKWLGESERNVARLFERARENSPSVIFIDEIDGIASSRGSWGTYDRQLTELLEQMDGIAGQQGVTVIAATNRPAQLDPALLRGGRLSRTIELPLPDEADRLQLLKIFTNEMPLVGVDLADVARQTDGFSGADLRALVQQAGLHSLISARRRGVRATAVRGDDFDAARKDHIDSRAAVDGKET